jgi:hypothetical protein
MKAFVCFVMLFFCLDSHLVATHSTMALTGERAYVDSAMEVSEDKLSLERKLALVAMGQLVTQVLIFINREPPNRPNMLICFFSSFLQIIVFAVHCLVSTDRTSLCCVLGARVGGHLVFSNRNDLFSSTCSTRSSYFREFGCHYQLLRIQAST